METYIVTFGIGILLGVAGGAFAATFVIQHHVVAAVTTAAGQVQAAAQSAGAAVQAAAKTV